MKQSTPLKKTKKNKTVVSDNLNESCDVAFDSNQDSRFLLYQQYHTNGSTIMTKTDVHTNTNLTSMSAMT